MDLGSSKRKSLSKDEYAVGWIAALDSERAAAEAMLDEEHNKPHDFTKPSTDNNSHSWGRSASTQRQEVIRLSCKTDIN